MCEPRVKHILPALVIVPKVVLRIDLCIGGKFKLRSQFFCRQSNQINAGGGHRPARERCLRCQGLGHGSLEAAHTARACAVHECGSCMARRERTRNGGAMTGQQQTCDREKRRSGAALQQRWPKGSKPNCRRRLVLGRARTGQLGALPATLTVHYAKTG